MFVKEISNEYILVHAIRNEMISGRMTLYRRNEIVDYLKRMVSKYRRRLYIPREIIAIRQLIEDLGDFEICEVFEDVNDEILEESSDFESDCEAEMIYETEVLHVVADYNDEIPKEADISIEAEIFNKAEIPNKTEESMDDGGNLKPDMPSEKEFRYEVEMCNDVQRISDEETLFELVEPNEAEISFETDLQLAPVILNEMDIQFEVEIPAEAEMEAEGNILVDAEIELEVEVRYEADNYFDVDDHHYNEVGPYAEDDEIFKISFKRDPNCRGH